MLNKVKNVVIDALTGTMGIVLWVMYTDIHEYGYTILEAIEEVAGDIDEVIMILGMIALGFILRAVASAIRNHHKVSKEVEAKHLEHATFLTVDEPFVTVKD